MAPPKKRDLAAGGRGYGYNPEDAAFLTPDSPTGSWVDDYSGASESGTYQSRRFDDNTGHFRGANWDDSESHGLRNKQADEAQASIRDIGDLIYSQADQPGGPLFGGGGPVSNNVRDPDDSSWRGSGRKGPRYSNPLGRSGQGNMKGHK